MTASEDVKLIRDIIIQQRCHKKVIEGLESIKSDIVFERSTPDEARLQIKQIDSILTGGTVEEVPVCPECGEERPDDERAKGGMKCSFCAYP